MKFLNYNDFFRVNELQFSDRPKDIRQKQKHFLYTRMDLWNPKKLNIKCSIS